MVKLIIGKKKQTAKTGTMNTGDACQNFVCPFGLNLNQWK